VRLVAVVVIDEAWRWEEVKGVILLEVLVAGIRRAKANAVGGKKVCICVFSPAGINVGTGCTKRISDISHDEELGSLFRDGMPIMVR
jgi:hypothetical protein